MNGRPTRNPRNAQLCAHQAQPVAELQPPGRPPHRICSQQRLAHRLLSVREETQHLARGCDEFGQYLASLNAEGGLRAGALADEGVLPTLQPCADSIVRTIGHDGNPAADPPPAAPHRARSSGCCQTSAALSSAGTSTAAARHFATRGSVTLPDNINVSASGSSGEPHQRRPAMGSQPGGGEPAASALISRSRRWPGSAAGRTPTSPASDGWGWRQVITATYIARRHSRGTGERCSYPSPTPNATTKARDPHPARR